MIHGKRHKIVLILKIKRGVDPRFKDVRLLHGGYSKQLYRVSIYGIWRRKQEKKRILLSEGGYVIYGNHVC